MSTKKLIIAEKPSVARDIAKVLDDTFVNDKSYLVGDKYIVSWSIGHLLQLAPPDHYDKKYKRWSKTNLPITVDKFDLVASGNASSKAQLSVLKKLLVKDEVSEVINACDAGREGEGADPA